MSNMSNNILKPVWYALRVTYNREMKVKADLDARGITCFVPMKVARVECGGQLVKKFVPSVHNLIFVLLDPKSMREYKATTALPIRYIMDREKHCPIIVPTEQMENFMRVAGTNDESLIYLTPEPGGFKRGDRVRILGGIFKDAEGVLTRVKGDRRVVVAIQGVVAVATAYIHPSYIEKITDPS